LTLDRTAAAAPAANIHFEGIRIMPTPLSMLTSASVKRLALNLSWFKHSGKPPERACSDPARLRYVVKLHTGRAYDGGKEGKMEMAELAA